MAKLTGSHKQPAHHTHHAHPKTHDSGGEDPSPEPMEYPPDAEGDPVPKTGEDPDMPGEPDMTPPKPEVTDAVPGLQGIDPVGVYTATYYTVAGNVGKIALLGNMPQFLPATGAPGVITDSQVETYQARRLVTLGIMTEQTAPKWIPLAKNWRLKKGPDQRRITGSSFEYIYQGTVPFILRSNGLSMTIMPGGSLYVVTDAQKQQMARLLALYPALWVTFSVAITTTTLSAAALIAGTAPLVATVSMTSPGTNTYAWTQMAGPTATIAAPTALSTTLTYAGAVAGQSMVFRFTATNSIYGPVSVTSPLITLDV